MEKRRCIAKEKEPIILNDFAAIDDGGKVDLHKTRRDILNRFMQISLFDAEDGILYEQTKRRFEEGIIGAIQCLNRLTGIDLTPYKPTMIPSCGKSKEPFLFSKKQSILLVYSNINKSAEGMTASELDIYNKIFYIGIYLHSKNVPPRHVSPVDQVARYERRGSTEALGELFAILSLHEQPENRNKNWEEFAGKNIDVLVTRQFRKLGRVNPKLSRTVFAGFEKNVELAKQVSERDGNFTAYVRQKVDEMPKHLGGPSEELYVSIVIGHVIARAIYPYRRFVETQIGQRVGDLDQTDRWREKLEGTSVWII